MKRRAFLGLLGVAAAAIVIPERTIFLPPAGGWYLKDYTCFPTRLHEDDLPDNPFGYDNSLATAVDLSEQSLEDMLIQIRQMTDDRGLALTLRPTRRIVSPTEYRWITQGD